MAKLIEPYEIFDIGDGESVVIDVIDVIHGDQVKMTREDESFFFIGPLRLVLTAPIKSGLMSYLDVTSKRLTAILEPLLAGVPPAHKRLKITKRGVAPRALFSVEQLP